MRINHNLMAINTHRQLGVTQTDGAKSTEKLSSGLRINRAGDDAAGLAISEKMRGQIRGLTQASRNANDTISLIQTAEGALNETHSIIQRMRELAVQAANDSNTDSDRAELQSEISQLIKEVDRIGNTTEFNTKNLLDGSLRGVSDDVNATAKINPNSAVKVNLDLQNAFGASVKDDTNFFMDGAHMLVRVNKSGQGIEDDFKFVGPDGTEYSFVKGGTNELAAGKLVENSILTSAQKIGSSAVDLKLLQDFSAAVDKLTATAVGATPTQVEKFVKDYVDAAGDDSAIAVAANNFKGAVATPAGLTDSIMEELTKAIDKLTDAGVTTTQASAYVKAVADVASTDGGAKMDDLIKAVGGLLGKGVTATDIKGLVTELGALYASTAPTATQIDNVLTKYDSLTGADFADVKKLVDAMEPFYGTSAVGDNTKIGALVDAIDGISGVSSLSTNVTIGTGSTVADGSVLSKDTILAFGSKFTIDKDTSITLQVNYADVSITMDGNGTVKVGDTVLAANSSITLKDGTTLKQAAAGVFEVTQGNVKLAKSAKTVATGAGINTVTQNSVLATGSTLQSNSSLGAGSVIGSTKNSLLVRGSVDFASDMQSIKFSGKHELKADFSEIDVSLSTTWVMKSFQAGSNDLANSMMSQVGANGGQIMFVSMNDMRAAALGIDTIDVSSRYGAAMGVEKINNALEKVSHQRATLGAVQNRLEHTIKNLDTAAENLQASEARIRDVDMAKEVMENTKQNILQQAAQAMLAQANQAPQSVLQLLR